MKISKRIKNLWDLSGMDFKEVTKVLSKEDKSINVVHKMAKIVDLSPEVELD